MRKNKQLTKAIPLMLVAGLVLFTSYWLAQFVETNQTIQNIIINTGYVGPMVLALLFGLSVVIPFPPGAFAPAFTAAGLYMPLVIVMLTIGTTIADLSGFFVGKISKPHVKTKHPKLYQKIKKLRHSRPIYTQIFVFVMTAFIPFPNEAWIIPFGMIGFRLNQFIIPMMLGTLLHHTMVALGLVTLFASI